MEANTLTEQKSLLATLPPGKRARLHRLLFEFGPGNGTMMLLPIDQGIEHGPRDFFPNPASKDPEYQFKLAAEADKKRKPTDPPKMLDEVAVMIDTRDAVSIDKGIEKTEWKGYVESWRG